MRYKRNEAFRYTFPEHIPALFKLIINDNKVSTAKGKAEIIDISGNGMRINSELSIPDNKNQDIKLLISFKLNDIQLKIPGRIAWKKARFNYYQYGLHLDIDEEKTNELIHQLKIFSRKMIEK